MVKKLKNNLPMIPIVPHITTGDYQLR